jgi:hypothetical protein
MRLLRDAAVVATIVLTLTLLLGCGPVEAEGTREASAQDARSVFLDAFQDAYSRQDIEAAVALVHLDGVRNRPRSAIRYQEKFAELFALKIVSLSIGPPDEALNRGYLRGGTRYRANLDIVATLVVEFDPDVTRGLASSTFPLGRVGTELRIATAAPLD